jgi:outer membrane protein assembly factor BamB
LYAVTNSGPAVSNKWIFTSAGPVLNSPAISTNGSVLFVGGNGDLCAVNPNGSLQWRIPVQAGTGSPAIAVDGIIYIEGYPSLYAISPSGSTNWQHAIGDQTFLSPSVATDGTIYIGSHDGQLLFAINPDGSEKWRYDIGPPGDSAAIGADGTVYIASYNLFAFSEKGTNLWLTSTNSFSGSSPVIGKDGTIYIACNADMSLYSIKPTGEVNWHVLPTTIGAYSNVTTCAAIDASGLIYYCNSNKVYAITPSGNVQWMFTSPSGFAQRVSPAIGPDGTIYAVFGNTLYAIAGTNALGNTPWPMYRQNLRHTGKLEKPSLNQPKKRADAGFEFEMFGEVGQPYTIQKSTNLASWAVVTNFIASTQTTSVVDFTASNSPSRFYRALIQ